MNVLALDTSTEACSAALIAEETLYERFEVVPRRHAELILPMIESVLAQADLSIMQIDAVAFGGGPGAFTGVRIATAIAQGIAFALNISVVPVSTLAALAYATMREYEVDRVAVAIDARMQEVYWGLYETDEHNIVRQYAQEQVCAPQQVIAAEGGVWYGAGSGWGSYGAILSQQCPVKGFWPDRFPAAGAVAMIGAALAAQGKTVPPGQALPVYLRDNIATPKPG